MAIYAVLSSSSTMGGKVVNMVSSDGAVKSNWVATAGLGFSPQIGWTYSAETGVFTQPAPVPTVVLHKVTRRAFMQRFTQPERTLIRKSTDDIVIDIYEDLQAVNNVDLSLQDTINALAYLTGVGILAAGRSDTILNTPVTEDEV